MTSRDLCFMALRHEQPPRLPWTLYLAPEVQGKLEGVWGPRDQWPVPQDDLLRILWEVQVENLSPTRFRDRFGCQWQREHGGYVFIEPPMGPAKARPLRAAGIPRLQLLPEEDVTRIRQARAERPEAFIFYQFTATLGERLWCLRGLEQTLEDYLLNPRFVHEALDVLMEMHLEALDTLAALPVEGITFGDDFGSQRGLMISPRIFREFYRPRYQVLYDRVRGMGKVVGHHSCGDNTDLMGDFVAMGLQVFHPLQPECMDLAAIKREYGRDLTFRGGIGTQGAMVFGTPEQARDEVRRAVDILRVGGGYFLETAKPLPPETPVANAVAVIEALVAARG
jgi:uroporphyrinogen decarboxylase